jgi:TrmH family RNA methyltransferase
MEIISSPANNHVKKLKLLSTKKGRGRFGEFIIEGIKNISSVPVGFEISIIAMSETFYKNYGEANFKNFIIVKDSLFDSLSDTVTPQGILAVVKKKVYTYEDFNGANPFIIVVHDLRDPGNIGAIIRTADAVNATAVVITGDSADIYNPKVVRATAGSILNVPIIHDDIESALNFFKRMKISVLATHVYAEESLYSVDLTRPMSFIIGNEGQGLPESVVQKADLKIKIPMPGKAESLNASVAGAVVMYEVLRQRLRL